MGRVVTTFLPLLVCMSIHFCCLAQNEMSNWFFGRHAGIRFHNNTISQIPNSLLYTNEGCATASDSTGQLLFYTDGVTVYNRFHMILADNLTGNNTTTQSAMAVFHPADPNLYYLFTVKQNGLGGISYTKLNMSTASGSVQAINIALDTITTTEKITAIRAFNGIDTWIVTHGWENNNIYAYLLTAAGLSTTPVISPIGSIHGGYFENSIGYMKSSPDGYWLAAAVFASNYVELYRFDNVSGQVSSSTILIDPLCGGPYGIEFSPNGRLLYVTGSSSSRVIQWDLSSNNDLIIPTTSQLVGFVPHEQGHLLSGLQLGPDKRIYITRDSYNALSIIKFPNNVGPGCAFQKDAVPISGQGVLGLPNFPSYLESEPFEAFPLCLGDSTAFVPSGINVYDSVLWVFGDPASGSFNFSSDYTPKRVYQNTGTYTVTLIRYRSGMAQYQTKDITIVPIPHINLGNDTSICTNASLLLDATYPGASYLWHNGSTQATYSASSEGTYWARVSIPQGCSFTDTIQLELNPLPQFVLPNDTVICQSNPWFLQTHLSAASYAWNTGSTDSSISISQTGTYSLTVTNGFQCNWKDSLVVQSYLFPWVSLPNDTTICGERTFLILPVSGEAQSYGWTDGYTGYNRVVADSGRYIVSVSNVCGTAYDTIQINYLPYPVNRLGNDTTLCNVQSYDIRIPAGLKSWIWENGITDSVNRVFESGTYYLYAFDLCYFYIDSIKVQFSEELFVPNVITANSDGMNDCFEVKVGNKENYKLQIFNRWGKEIYSATDPGNKWCGGNENGGNYYYYIQYSDCQTEPQIAKGMVLLVK